MDSSSHRANVPNRAACDGLGRRFWIGLFFLGLLWIDAAAAQEEPKRSEVWSRNYGYVSAPTPLAVDLNLDGAFEVVQVDLTNRVSAIRAEDGETIWERELGEYTLMTPVTGHFMGNGRINLVVPTASGLLFLLDGATGEVLGNQPINCGFTLTQPPTVFPWTADDPEAPYREGLLLFHPSRQLEGYLISPRRGLNRIFQYRIGEHLAGPPAVGETALPTAGPHIVVTTREGEVYVIPARQPERTIRGELKNQQRCRIGAGLGDLTGDGKLEIVVGDDAGYLHAMRVAGGTLKPVWTNDDGTPKAYRSILKPPRYRPITMDVNGDGRDDIVVVRREPTGLSLLLLNGRTGRSLWNPEALYPTQYPHDRNIQSPPALFQGAQGEAHAVFCDDLGVVLLDLQQCRMQHRVDIGHTCNVTPLLARFGEDASALVFVRAQSSGTGYMIDLGVDFAQEGVPWFGLHGSPLHTGNEPKAYHAYKQAQKERLGRHREELLAKARRAARESRWEEALKLVDQVMMANPHHREAIRLRRHYAFRVNLELYILSGLVVLVVLAGLAWIGIRAGWRGVMQARVRRAHRSGQPKRAAALLEKMCRRFPRKKDHWRQLADLYIEMERFDERTASIFEGARQRYPDEDQYLRALATAYSSIPRRDEAAAEAYRKMAAISKKAGPWYYILGQTLMQLGHDRDALEAFRKAILNHYDHPNLPEQMSELYVRLGITSPEILPTLDRVLEAGKGNRGFLKTYCLACQEARRYDETAQQVAQWLLEQDPADPAAHAILATRLLQAGRYKDAMLHAEQILEMDESSSIGLRLLGACYAAENRLDETAMKIFTRALEANPNAPEILIAVSHGYIQEGREDPEAEDLYQRALVHNPQDEQVLEQLSRIAIKRNDEDMTIRTLEALTEMGRRSRENVLQLADAYCRQGIVADKAESIYREALAHQPDHATIQDNLAAIYLRHERVDEEAMSVYECALQRNPERFDLGLQLIRCYHEAQWPEKVLELGHRLERQQPQHTEVQKLVAAASAKAEQMDSAIEGYEKLLEANPDDIESLCQLSKLYGCKRRSDDNAIGVYVRSIEHQPEEREHYVAAIRAYGERKSWDNLQETVQRLMAQDPAHLHQTIELVESLIDATPKAHALRWYLIDTLIYEGRLRDAHRHLSQIIRLDPAQSEQALSGFNRILEKNPKDAMAHLERGRILWGLGRQREARFAMEQALTYKPNNEQILRALMDLYQQILDQRDSVEVRFQLGRLAMTTENHDLAIACFQHTARDYRWESDSLRLLAQCFMAKGMLDLALQEMKRLPIDEDVKELLYELGQRYEAVGDLQGAREVYKLIFASDINYRDVKGKLEGLSEVGGGKAINIERTAIINSLSEEAKQRYELVQELGRGAMGIVYKARDNELDEFVALKILPENLSRNPEAVRRFRQEARSARRLSHPNIVRIHDIGEEMGRKYISMEFVEGTDLKQLLRRHKRRIPLAKVIRYIQQICEAMGYAHASGIVHRDLKPANLMISNEDAIKVSDFGIAKMVEESQARESTKVGAVIGTPLYMSPEQVKGQAVDYRADIYSMGVVFYEMITGHPPFTEGDLSYQHMFADPKPIESGSLILDELVMTCLHKEKEQRWQSIDEMKRQLAMIDRQKPEASG